MSKQARYPKYNILGVEIDALTSQQSLDYIRELTTKDKPSFVVKPYVEFLDKAAQDPRITSLLNSAELALADGVALNWAAYYLYGGGHGLGRLIKSLAQIIISPVVITRILPSRTQGPTFTRDLLKYCQKHGLKVYLVGSPKRRSIASVATYISNKFPGLAIVGIFHGNIDRTNYWDKLTKDIKSKNPDIILIGTGFPKQEQMMHRLVGELKRGVMIGEGGSFDFRVLGGHISRAPKFISNIGLEWLWRLVREPNRGKRQLAIPRFILQVYQAGKHDPS